MVELQRLAIMGEQKRREQAVKEKADAVEKLNLYAQVYEALKINEPEQFMQDYQSVQNEIVSLS